ncbi:ESSS subunit of NADH:ubiquinone oxidoreductase [Halenospora varia]|nr:ESSS subunit of NADH:ubiquinone oxidoreductase [Halenospora varia]
MRVLPQALAAARAVRSSQIQLQSSQRAFSTGNRLRSGAHEEHFEPPSGWLFGVKPGEKAEKEGWENLWVYGFFGSLGLGVVGYAFKPDTSIQTWALEEARRRLEVEGILKEPESKS